MKLFDLLQKISCTDNIDVYENEILIAQTTVFEFAMDEDLLPKYKDYKVIGITLENNAIKIVVDKEK